MGYWWPIPAGILLYFSMHDKPDPTPISNAFCLIVPHEEELRHCCIFDSTRESLDWWLHVRIEIKMVRKPERIVDRFVRQ
jgi:hypothetical protein